MGVKFRKIHRKRQTRLRLQREARKKAQRTDDRKKRAVAAVPGIVVRGPPEKPYACAASGTLRARPGWRQDMREAHAKLSLRRPNGDTFS